jgi:putative membrane protein
VFAMKALPFGRKLLVLYVDRDGDISNVTGVKTPIIGKEANLKAAIDFILKAPDEADANALFAAIKLYDELLREGFECELATVAGVRENGVKADMKIAEEVDKVLEKYNADGIVFVSDGASDERVIPILQARVPIVSANRVLVKQVRGLEDTYSLFIKYWRDLVENPRYSLYLLGLPGIFLVVLAILVTMGYAHYAGVTLLLILGFTMTVKGFNLDKRLSHSWSTAPVLFFGSLITLITLIVALYLGASAVVSAINRESSLANVFSVGVLIGIFLINPKSYNPIGYDVTTIDLIVIALVILLIAKGLHKHLSDGQKVWHEAVSTVFCLLLRQPLVEMSLLLLDPQRSSIVFATWMAATVVITVTLAAFFIAYERLKR